jgi:hypothetical protein
VEIFGVVFMTESILMADVSGSNYQWATQIPPTCDMPQPSDLTSAAEQMFFTGAPLAHVVTYEEQLRLRRLRGASRAAADLVRLSR